MPKNLQTRFAELKTASKPNPEIIETLKKEGYSSQDIYDTMATPEKKPQGEAEKELAPPTPSEEMGATPLETGEMDATRAEIDTDSPEPTTETPSFMSTEKFPAPKHIPQRQNIEEIEELAESIIEEKMNELSVNFTDLNMWKEKTATELEAIKQEILRLRNQSENLQTAMVGKVDDYKKTLGDVSVEVKTLSKVLDKILQPLTMNVKELGRITDRLKK